MTICYLIPLFPLLGCILLLLSNSKWSENLVATISIVTTALSTMTTIFILVNYYNIQQYININFYQTIWHWIKLDNLNIPVTFMIDGLSLTIILLITSVGLLIQIYSSWYMRGEYAYTRFFTYINLFIASMLVLILADNMLIMYMAWEIVGLCSYLLIGFYHHDLKNCMSAIKAFMVTKFGDILLALALIIIFNQFRTLNFHELAVVVNSQKLINHSMLITTITLLLLGGAVGKSAQLPLHIWLPEAMVGPTPVSALIHSSTMVIAGVYLIARMYTIFIMAPTVLYVIGVTGVITALLASCAALVQVDIKRILAYSTMSQIGYMFLALGLQAWQAAIFHLVIHAFLKALLFLSTGSIILSCNHEQNIFKMGGLRKSIPFIYICFLIGGLSLSAFPIITAGFYSKDAILWNAFVKGHNIFLILGLVGSFLTSLYTFRMIFVIFHGIPCIKTIKAKFYNSITHTIPLTCLSILSTCISVYIQLPLKGVFPYNEFNDNSKIIIELISGSISIIGITIAAILWIYQYKLIKYISTTTIGNLIYLCWYHAYGIDWFYNKIFISPYLRIANLLTLDPIDRIINASVLLIRNIGHILTISENGQLRWYMMSISLGAIFVIMILMFTI